MLQMADKNVLKNAIQESVKLQSCANKTNKDNHIPVSAKTILFSQKTTIFVPVDNDSRIKPMSKDSLCAQHTD